MTYAGHAKAIALLGLPLIGGNLAQFAIVITSYSIHYTKLYDHHDTGEAPGPAPQRGASTRILEDGRDIGPFKAIFGIEFVHALFGAVGDGNLRHGGRITSYNVCYTKLLRRKRLHL